MINLSDLKNKKTAFVLSGGVVKAAAWHIGVAQALEDLGFEFSTYENLIPSSAHKISTYIGSSSGCLVALYLASGHDPHTLTDVYLNPKYTGELRPINYKDILSIRRKFIPKALHEYYSPLENFPFGIRSLLRPFFKMSGLFSTTGLHNYLTNIVLKSQEFEKYPDLFIVATQLDHSRKVIFSKYKYPNPKHDQTISYYQGVNIADAAAASMSLPPFYTPYPIVNPHTGNIDYYIDGEIRETLSTHIAMDTNCEVIFSSWTHSPYHFQSEIGSLVNYGIPSIAVQSIYLLLQKKIVNHRNWYQTHLKVLDIVSEYLKENHFNNTKREELLSILENKLNVKKNVQLIDLFPSHDDYKTFFTSSFSLKKEDLKHLSIAGHKRTFRIIQEKFS